MLPTPATVPAVLAAITAGHNTLDQLAVHFGVPAGSYNLRADVRHLIAAGTVTVDTTNDTYHAA